MRHLKFGDHITVDGVSAEVVTCVPSDSPGEYTLVIKYRPTLLEELQAELTEMRREMARTRPFVG